METMISFVLDDKLIGLPPPPYGVSAGHYLHGVAKGHVDHIHGVQL